MHEAFININIIIWRMTLTKDCGDVFNNSIANLGACNKKKSVIVFLGGKTIIIQEHKK